MKKLKMAVEDLTRQNGDLNGLKARLTQENFELQVRNHNYISWMNDCSCNQMEEWKGSIHDENFELQVNHQNQISVLNDRSCNQWDSGKVQ